MTTWTEVGGNPAPGRPDQIRSVANHFGELSVAARLARTQLAALQRGELRACWTGVAADAFASELEILPADLGKLETSLDHASTAVHRWASTVDHAQQRAETERRSYDSAEQQLRTARYELDRERQAMISEGLIDPISVIGEVLSGNNRLAPYERRADDAHDQVRRIQNHIDQIREDVDATARTIANLLDEASRLGIQNKDIFQKIGDFFTALGEALIVVLKFLDELVDLIAPWVGMALLILSFINPAFALVAVAFAALDFGLTASRALLGDDEVTALDLLDDGIDLALALVGAKGANAGLGVIDDFGRAAKDGGKLIKAADTALNVVGGAKVVGDYYLNLGGMIGVGPGSTFDLVVDVSSGDTSGWAPGEGPAYGSDYVEATGGLIDLVSGGGDGGGSSGLVDLVSGGGSGDGGGSSGLIDLVTGGGDGGAMPDLGSMSDGGGMPDLGSMPDSGVSGGDFAGGGQGEGSGLVADGITTPGSDLASNVGASDVGGNDAGGSDVGGSDVGGRGAASGPPDSGGLMPDVSRPVESASFDVLTPNELPATGLVPDSAPAATMPADASPAPTAASSPSPGIVADTATSAGASDGLKLGVTAGAAAVGLGAAVAGAKRSIDKKNAAQPEPGDSPAAARQALIGTSEFVVSEFVESPAVEVARVEIAEGHDDE